MQLQPQEYFTLFIQIDDHTDLNRDNYFCRAVVRNARTSALIATVNLDSKGNGEYSKEWQVPADVSGLGFYIKIVTSVYTDASYATKVPEYADEGNVYLVQERNKSVHVGGADIDYKKVRQIVVEEIAKIPAVEIPEPRPVDLSSVLMATDRISAQIAELPIPKDTKIDFTPLLQAIEDVKTGIVALNKEPEKVDFAPVLERLSQIGQDLVKFSSIEQDISSLQGYVEGKFDETQKSIEEIGTNFENNLKKSREKVVGTDYRGRQVVADKENPRLRQ